MQGFLRGGHAPYAPRLSVALVAALFAAQVGAASLTRGPHLDSVTQVSAVVVFWTDASCAATVRYGPGTDLTQTATDGTTGTRHAVRLDGLTAGATYGYQVEACGAAIGSAHSFETAPPKSTPTVHFAAMGDMGTGGTQEAAVGEAIRAKKPELWVALGDNAYDYGTEAEFTSRFFKPLAPMLAEVPSFPSMGNHEYYTNNAQPYLDAFTLMTNNPVGTERYYSFDWGPVHFVSIDSMCAANYDGGSCDGDAMMAWLRDDLSKTDRPWKVAYFHHPPFSTGEHQSSVNIRHLLGPVFEQYGVDMVLTGHDHDYERTKPMKGDAVDAQNGITYWVVGSGGAPLRPFATTADFTAYKNTTDYGFLDVTVDGGTMTAKFTRTDGTVLDTWTRTKTVVTPEAPTVTATAEPARGAVPLHTTLVAQTNIASPTVTWELGDGRTASGATVAVEYATAGAFTATVTATGASGTATATVAIAADPANCEATNTCVVVADAGPGTGTSNPPGTPEPPGGGCGGAAGAVLLPIGALGMRRRKRR